MSRHHTIALAIAALIWAGQATAQGQMPNAQAPVALPEGIQIGLSTDEIRITADFSGADLTIFGSVENPDPYVSRQGRYDVIVVLEGPSRPVTIRRKDRVLGIWMNTQSELFVNVPESYSISTTRMPQDIAGPVSYKQLALGTSQHSHAARGSGSEPCHTE